MEVTDLYKYVSHWLGRFRSHRWSQDPKQSLATAKALARQALDVEPDNLGALKALAGAQMFAGDLAESMSTTQRVLALSPNDAHAHRDLAANFNFLGRWEAALRQLEVAERLNPLDASHMWKVNDMATLALIALHRHDEAIERARRNMAIHPTPIRPLALTSAALRVGPQHVPHRSLTQPQQWLDG